MSVQFYSGWAAFGGAQGFAVVSESHSASMAMVHALFWKPPTPLLAFVAPSTSPAVFRGRNAGMRNDINEQMPRPLTELITRHGPPPSSTRNLMDLWEAGCRVFCFFCIVQEPQVAAPVHFHPPPPPQVIVNGKP